MLSILYGHYPPLGSGGGPGAWVPSVLQIWVTDSTVQDHQFGYLVRPPKTDAWSSAGGK